MRFFVLSVLLALTLAACDTLVEAFLLEPAAPVDVVLVERGIEVYRANYCGTCHALAVANTRGTFGPNHDTAGFVAAQTVTLAGYTGAAVTPEAYIRESILNPTAYYTAGYESTNHHMPAFGHLPPEDIDAMVYMLIQQR